MSYPFVLQVPADERYRGLAPEVAGKYVELSGGSAADGQVLADELNAALRKMAMGEADVVDLSFTAKNGHVEVTLASGGRSTVVRVALPARR
jgi:hypothetical protein